MITAALLFGTAAIMRASKTGFSVPGVYVLIAMICDAAWLSAWLG